MDVGLNGLVPPVSTRQRSCDYANNMPSKIKKLEREKERICYLCIEEDDIRMCTKFEFGRVCRGYVDGNGK